MFSQRNLFLLTFAVCLVFVVADVRFVIDIDEDSVKSDGVNTEMVNDFERKVFHATDDELKQAAEVVHGARPTDVYVRSPTPWNDLYRTYNWEEVRHSLRATGIQSISTSRKDVAIVSQGFENKLNESINFSFRIEPKESPISLNHERSKSDGFGREQELEYSLRLKLNTYGFPSVIIYKTSGEQFHNEVRHVIIGGNQSLSFTVQPQRKVIAKLVVEEVSSKIRIGYMEDLSGQVALNYEKPHKSHHFWAIDVNSLLEGINQPKEISSLEDITVKYYAKARAEIRDEATNFIMTTMTILIQMKEDNP